MKKVAVIGAGVSGLTVAQLLKDRYPVVVYEKDTQPGGLIKCKRVEGSLFHPCRGLVFNSKFYHVLDWFWSRFDQDQDFVKADRNSSVIMPDGQHVPYPIENHVYMLADDIVKGVITDIITMAKQEDKEISNFEEFLVRRFGKTLYDIYFEP